MGKIGMPELIVILVIVLLIFGAGRLPQIAKSMAEGIKEFKNTMSGKKGEEDKTDKTDKGEEKK